MVALKERMQERIDRSRQKQQPKVDTDKIWNPDAPEPSTAITPHVEQGVVVPGARTGEQVLLVPFEDVRLQLLAQDREQGEDVLAHPRQSQATDEDLQLRQSIREHGIQVPLIVRPAGVHDAWKWTVVKGSRRYLQLGEIIREDTERSQTTGEMLPAYVLPVIVRNISRREATRLSFILTAHQKELTLGERARALLQIRDDLDAELHKYLEEGGLLTRVKTRQIITAAHSAQMERYMSAPDWVVRAIEHSREAGRKPRVSNDELARQVGFSVSRLEEILRYNNLAAPVQQLLVEGEISGLQATALAAIKEPETQARVARKAVNEGMSGADIREHIRSRRLDERSARPTSSGVVPEPLANLRLALSAIAAAAGDAEARPLDELARQEAREGLRLLREHLERLVRAVDGVG